MFDRNMTRISVKGNLHLTFDIWQTGLEKSIVLLLRSSNQSTLQFIKKKHQKKHYCHDTHMDQERVYSNSILIYKHQKHSSRARSNDSNTQ